MPRHFPAPWHDIYDVLSVIHHLRVFIGLRGLWTAQDGSHDLFLQFLSQFRIILHKLLDSIATLCQTGISKSGEIVDLGVEYGILKKSGSWFSYGDTRLAQGRDAAKQVMQDNPELADELEQKIMAAILGSPQNPEPDEDSEMMKD